MRRTRFRIRSLMIAVAASGGVFGLVVAMPNRADGLGLLTLAILAPLAIVGPEIGLILWSISSEGGPPG